ncbi:unnamed protein product [Linum tenue]|uniref:Uncharacterized protein n=1 Tax=Linum tenue TaxID=586396 RepID=A0AAV0LPH6_9ROSI|nr:unnamed protein product [Linum tenue]
MGPPRFRCATLMI